MTELDVDGILSLLQRHEVQFVLIGGLAGFLWGSGLATFDIDICYARDMDNLARLASALVEMEAKLRNAPDDVPFLLDALTLKAGDSFTFSTKFGSVDILGTPSGTTGFNALNNAATDFDVDLEQPVRTASLDDLIAMKRAAGRKKDLIALEILGRLRDEIDARNRAERGRP